MKLAHIAILLATLFAAPAAHSSPTQGTTVASVSVPPRTRVMYSDIDLRANEVTSFDVSAPSTVTCLILDDKSTIVANVCHVKLRPPARGKYTLLVTNDSNKDVASATITIQ